MRALSPITRSIGARFAAVVCFTVTIVGTAGYFAGRSILEQVAALANDQAELQALTDGQKALVDLHRERRLRTEPLLNQCAAAKRPLECVIPGVDVSTESIPDSAGDLGWDTEATYIASAPKGRYRFTLDWEPIKPKYGAIADVIGIREHVTSLLPSLTASFLKVFAIALLGSMFLGLFVTFLLSRRFAYRVRQLIDYTRKIAAGELSPAPPSTLGQDEIGLLADAMHIMASDLDATRQRLVLAEKMQTWQNVARKVAHEIKNPLTPISLVAAELARKAKTAPPEMRATIEEASRILAEETESLGRMVREFSAFARLPDPDLQSGDLSEVVKDFVTRNETDKGPLFQVVGAESRFAVVIDRAMIIQILHNLVNNAALAKAPSRLTMTFSLVGIDSKVVLDMQDNASGVPESLRQTLFDAYVTSRSTGEGEKGMGLGLTISRKIAIDHGGDLVLHRTGPQGTCFRLTLPMTQFGVKS